MPPSERDLLDWLLRSQNQQTKEIKELLTIIAGELGAIIVMLLLYHFKL
jgi:hypothetical protein